MTQVKHLQQKATPAALCIRKCLVFLDLAEIIPICTCLMRPSSFPTSTMRMCRPTIHRSRSGTGQPHTLKQGTLSRRRLLKPIKPTSVHSTKAQPAEPTEQVEQADLGSCRHPHARNILNNISNLILSTVSTLDSWIHSSDR